MHNAEKGARAAGFLAAVVAMVWGTNQILKVAIEAAAELILGNDEDWK